MQTRPQPSAAHPSRVLAGDEDGPQELSGVVMLIALLLVLGALGLVAT